MPRVDELSDPIQWHEGMLLASQHFQQLSQRHEDLVYYHSAIVSPYHFGVRRLKWDPALLVSGRFRILEMEAILPDGLVVSHAGERRDSLEIDLAAKREELGHAPGTVHLVVPARRRASGNHEGEMPRFEVVTGDPVRDQTSGDGEVLIPRLRPLASLLLVETPPGKYASLPLAQVRYHNESFQLTDYVAPHLEVGHGSPIWQMCDNLAKRLREKARLLSARTGSPQHTLGSPLLLETRIQVSSLVAALPHFEALISTGVAHPFALYLSLCGVVGQVSSLGTGLVPPPLPPYNHHDIRAGFRAAIEHIERMLEEGILESYKAYPFTFEQDENVFSISIAPTFIGRELVLGVRGQPGMSESDIIKWMDMALIGSSGNIPSLSKNRMLGAERTRIDRDRDLVPSRGTVLFSLKFDPRYIDRNIQIVNVADRPGGLLPAEIILYVKNQA